MPHVFVILVVLVILSTVLTYIIPAGTYERIVDEATKQTIVDPDSFHFISNAPISFTQIPVYIYNAIVKAANTIFMVIIGTAAIEVLIATGAFDVALKQAMIKLRGREEIALVGMMAVFALLGINTNSVRYIAYVPLLVMMFRLCGYDAMTAVAVLIAAVGGTFSCGIASMSITAVAQDLAGLPKFSGLWFRVLSAVVIFIISVIYILRYARKVKKDPSKSVVYELEQNEKDSIVNIESLNDAKMDLRKWGVVIVFAANVVISVIGCLAFNWGNAQVCGLAMFLAVIGGLIGGFNLNEISRHFAKGASKCLTTGLMIGIAGAISSVMTDGKIVDTVVYAMVSLFNLFPRILQPAVLYVLNTIINVFITSGSGQAAVVMPIFIPLSDIVGITRQTCVLAFNFGDGFSNFIIPTAASLVGVIAVANITLPQWIKFFWKLFLAWSAAAMVLVTIAQMIHLGPI